MTVKQARLMADLKQEDMAKLLGMHRNTYAAYEKEPGRFTVEQANRFCKVTEQGLEQVFGEGRKA